MASKDGVVPITRSYLASYYDKHPFPPLPDDVYRISEELRTLAQELQKEYSHSDAGPSVTSEADFHIPHRIDENLWKNREQIEEIISFLQKSDWQSALQLEAVCDGPEFLSIVDQLRVKFEGVFETLKSFQSRNSEHIFNTVLTYMPQDFRGKIIKQQKERQERNRQAEIDALISSGGSIHEKYALLWKQQMERRIQLAQLGSASGVYKTLVRYLVGVPQVLLDFIRQINDENGPMEEPRQRYGPPLYILTSLVLSIRFFLCQLCSLSKAKKFRTKQDVCALQRATEVYTAEFERFINFISEVFTNSPFFISAQEALAVESRKNDDYNEISIPAGKIHEVTLTVELIDSYIAWDFSLVQGKDVGFRLECTDTSSGRTTLMLPYQRHDSNEGNFCACSAGIYKLVWDNSYSTFSKKVLRYKVDCIPPVVDASQPKGSEG